VRFTAWALIVAERVALAQIAGVPPQNAFHAAPVALLAYALFGTSRFLVVDAISAAAVLSAAAVADVSRGPRNAAAFSAALAMLAGSILSVAGLAKRGFVADFPTAFETGFARARGKRCSQPQVVSVAVPVSR
jgi:SulP family sulfate permease